MIATFCTSIGRAAFALVLLSSGLLASSQEVLIDASGKRHAGPFVARDGAFLHPRDARLQYALEDVDRLILDTVAQPLRPKLGQFVHLRSGDRLRLTGVSFSKFSLQGRHWQLGDLQFERELLASLELGPCAGVPAAALRPGVRLADGSFSALVPQGMRGSEVALEHELLGSFKWQTEILSEVIFNPAPHPAAGLRIAASLESGERIVGELVSLDSMELRLITAWEPPAGQPLRLPRRVLRELVVLGGKLTYLADLPAVAASVAATPHPGLSPSPAAGRDRHGAPCIVRERTYWNSLTCTAGARLIYELPKGARELRMSIGICPGRSALLQIFKQQGTHKELVYDSDAYLPGMIGGLEVEAIGLLGAERLVIEVVDVSPAPRLDGNDQDDAPACVLISDPRILCAD